MAFNLLPSKWLNKRNEVAIRREDEQEHPAYSLQREMNRVFDDFFRSWDMPTLSRPFELYPFGALENNALNPRIDVSETDKEVRISAELPGLTEKDIDVSLTKDMLTIKGEKKQEQEENVKGWYRMERSYGTFMRSIALPCEVDEEHCNATFKNGVLTVSLSKTAQAQSNTKNIPVKPA